MYHPYDDEKYPKRKSPRLKGHDYASENCYFITICTNGKRCLFWREGQQNTFGKIAENGIKSITGHYPDLQIHQYVVMPNHVHMLVYVQEGKTKLDHAIGAYKAHVSREIHKINAEIEVWQSSFHDHIIRNQQEYQKIWLYIEGNPINWAKDCFYLE